MDYRTARAKAMKPTERQKKAAEGIKAGKSIRRAMVDAGYSQHTANMGMRAVPSAVLAMGVKGTSVYQTGRTLKVEDLRHLAIGRLAINMAEGKDGGVMSAKTAGSHRELNLWTADTQVGVILVQAPETHVKALKEVPEEEK